MYALVHGLAHLDRNRGQPTPELLGIRRASTFSGFCRHHDNDLFQPVEKSTFVGSSEQCFLLAFRALAREMHGKRFEWRTFNEILANVADHYVTSNYKRGLNAGVAHLRDHMCDYSTLLVARDYSPVHAYVIDFNIAPTVMCSGAIYPDQDFGGQSLQDLDDLSRRPDLLCFSCFFDGKRGVAMFAWLPGSDHSCSAFTLSLAEVPDSDLGSALVRFLFEYSDNIQLAPDWWEALPLQSVGKLLRRVGAASSFLIRRGPIHGDDEVYASWPVIDRYWINPPPDLDEVVS